MICTQTLSALSLSFGEKMKRNNLDKIVTAVGFGLTALLLAAAGLLNWGATFAADAFGTLGSIAGIAALVSLAGAAVMFILSILGLLHIRRTPLDATI